MDQAIPLRNHPLKNAHPLYALLYDNAIRHTLNESDEADGERLQIAIMDIGRFQNFESAAYSLLPLYNNFPRHVTIITEKMNHPGGNNPTYWATLRLTYEGINEIDKYKARLKEECFTPGEDPPLPTDSNILKFAKSLILRSVRDIVLFDKSKEIIIEQKNNYANKLISSGMFN